MSACRYVSTTQPRMVCRTEHAPREPICEDCTPCPEPHCRVCRYTHAEGSCAECLAQIRENLGEMQTKCGGLLTEATHRGVNGEAMMLLGPVANIEARQHWEASVLAGRITPMECDARELDDVAKWLNTADDERHPLHVVGTWAMVYRDAFEHEEPTSAVDIVSEAGYLARNLTYMAGFEWVPFEDFAKDLADSVNHLKAVLGDQDRGVRANVDCFDCGGDLERKLGKAGFDDVWTCSRCQRRYTIAEYHFALRAALEESA